MKVIIAMAGEGSRFRKAGIQVPKHEIVVQKKSLFEWSMLTLNDFFDEKFIFITRKGFYNKEFIYEKCLKLGIAEYEILEIDYLTDGQASTVMCSDKIVNDEDEILIYNIDTYVKENSILKKDILDDYEGFIPIFDAIGDKWSFVKLDNEENVIGVAEKKRISNWGSIGLYYFKSWRMYKEIFEDIEQDIKNEFKETYIAPMYKRLIGKGKKIGIKKINKDNVHVLGTPEDVDIFIEKFEL